MLLNSLVNKLGDPDSKVASLTALLLTKLSMNDLLFVKCVDLLMPNIFSTCICVYQFMKIISTHLVSNIHLLLLTLTIIPVNRHPNMKDTVVQEVERLLHRPNVSDKAQ